MARYLLISAVVGAPPGHDYVKFKRGTKIADTAENALAGDIIWPQLTAAPSAVNMRPLDSAAAAIMGLPITTLAELATSSIGGGCGQNTDT